MGRVLHERCSEMRVAEWRAYQQKEQSNKSAEVGKCRFPCRSMVDGLVCHVMFMKGSGEIKLALLAGIPYRDTQIPDQGSHIFFLLQQKGGFTGF